MVRTMTETEVNLESLVALKGKYTKEAGDTLATVRKKISDLMDCVLETGVVPTFISHTTWFCDKGTENLNKVAFTIRPSSKDVADVTEYKASFTLLYDDAFYVKYIEQVIAWVKAYRYTRALNENLSELQAAFDEICVNAEIPFTIKFKIGAGVIDVSDNSIELGISTQVLKDLSTHDLFYSLIPGNLEAIRASVGETLKSCVKAIDITKINNHIFKSLGIYSRKSLVSIVRGTVTRKVEFSRVGDSYIDTDDYFAVVRKTAITAEKAAELGNAYIIDNATATKPEIAAGLSKILVEYKVSPFNKNGETVNVDIKSIPGIVDGNK